MENFDYDKAQNIPILDRSANFSSFLQINTIFQPRIYHFSLNSRIFLLNSRIFLNQLIKPDLKPFRPKKEKHATEIDVKGKVWNGKS